jgi:general secretion pathway protein K
MAMAPKPLLAGLFTALGVKSEEAEGFADRILSWRTPLTAGASDGEATLYRSAGKNYGPRHGPFQHVDELGLVLGLPTALIDCAMPFLTVYSGQAGIDVFDAAPEVLSALPGISPDRLQILLSQRQGAPQDVLRAQLGMAAQFITARPSKANRITVAVRFDTKRRVRSQAVVLLGDQGHRTISHAVVARRYRGTRRSSQNIPDVVREQPRTCGRSTWDSRIFRSPGLVGVVTGAIAAFISPFDTI